MQTKRTLNSNMKVNQYVESKESKVSEVLNSLDYAKLGLGLVGLGICAPYMFPTLAGIQTATLIPVIADGVIKIASGVLGGIVTYVSIDIISENSKKSSPTIKVKDEKSTVTTSNTVNAKTVRVNNINDNKSDYNKEKEGAVIC